MAFEMKDYKDVPQRIADFKAKHPEGSLQPADVLNPFTIVEVAGQTFVVYTAAAYRTPDDPRPGIGVAWEPVPGKSTFTKLSELQNAETSAWGRAIVAVLASESKSTSSAEEVRNRQADIDPVLVTPDEAAEISKVLNDLGPAPFRTKQKQAFAKSYGSPHRVQADLFSDALAYAKELAEEAQ